MQLRLRRVRGERGFAVSSPLAVLSAVAVVAAGIAFVATNGDQEETAVREASRPVAAHRSASPPSRTPRAARPKAPKPAKAPVVHRGATYVEVFNNSGIHGLAGATAARAQGAGWQVVGSDNWYGTIDASTVYYPPRLRAAATLLARDLHIGRIKPAIAPMRGDRLTVILTADYA